MRAASRHSLGADVIDDSILIQRSLAGDSSAFGELVERYQGRLCNTLFHLVGGREEAEDVMQEAFVQAYVKLASFEGKSAFFTWLYRIAFNLSVSRKRRKRPEISVDSYREALGIDPEDGSEDPAEDLMRRERAAQLYQALDRLSEEHRAILVLREIEGCCYDTIGEILDLAAGTVRSRLHRARSHLRDQLEEILHESTPDN